MSGGAWDPAQRRHRRDARIAGRDWSMEERRRLVASRGERFLELLDDGCDIAQRCTQCPLCQCRFDNLPWFRRALAYTRKCVITQVLAGKGHNYHLTARELGMSVEAVHRAERLVLSDPNRLTREEVEALKPLVQTCGPTTRSKVHRPAQPALL